MNRPQKSPPKDNPATNPNTAAKAVDHSGKIKNQKIDKSGLTTRIQGHISARGKRTQAKRDSK